MIRLRKAEERGGFDHGWLKTFHTFSFADYFDRNHMGFRSLRVINEDYVAEAEGFDTHPHKDMEILTYVLEGALEHKDSMGNGSVIRPGEVQYMSAGSGVTHSEFNHSQSEKVHLLQIWILPAEKSATPRYGQKAFPLEERQNRLRLVASPDGRDGSIAIRQDASLFASVLAQGREVSHELKPGRHAWVQVARGEITLNGQRLIAGDGAAVSEEAVLQLAGKAEASEFLVFDLN